MSPKQFVAYYRVSTKAQGISRLGLDSQRESVARYVAAVGGVLAAEFEEVESGAKSERVQLQNALAACKSKGAMLVIAKLDRLARNVSFISRLLDSGVEFIAADMPTANRLTIHIVAAIAEYEREQISERVRGALQAAIARGAKVGNPKVREIQVLAVKAAQAEADAYARRMSPVISSYEAGGTLPLKRLAALMEIGGHKTPRGCSRWSANTIRKLKGRIRNLSDSTS